MRLSRILLVDDEADLCRTLGAHLSDLGHEIITAESAEEALNLVGDFNPDIVLTDVQMPGMDGFELLNRLRKALPEINVVVITGYGGVQGAIDAIKAGASDYLLKPLDLDEIEGVIERCMENRSEDPTELFQNEEIPEVQGGLVGQHPSMLRVYKTIGAVSRSRAPVLLLGETGTGKELIARTIHGNSEAVKEPFIAINCAAVPETLLESTLFGHLKGAFTGATSDRRGPFEVAGRGTIFLDEIGDTSLALQAKLLRVLEEGEFYPVGGEKARRTEARVIAATNRDLERLVQAGDFREDLYFRLRVIEISVPPLRERRSDIPILTRHILSKAAQELGESVPAVSQEVMNALLSREWPGNVRELENTLTRAMVMARGPRLTKHDLDGDYWGLGQEQALAGAQTETHVGEEVSTEGRASLESVERRHVQRVLLMTKGNKSAAARILEVSRPTLNRMIKDYELFTP